MLDRELPRLSGKSKLAEIIRYTLSRRTSFERFLADGLRRQLARLQVTALPEGMPPISRMKAVLQRGYQCIDHAGLVGLSQTRRKRKTQYPL